MNAAFAIGGNKYLQRPGPNQEEEVVVEEGEQEETNIIRHQYRPYQQKTCYLVVDSSEGKADGDSSTDEDDLCAQEQPYETPASIAYKPLLNQVPINELARRSDIVITSTLSLNLIAKDKRLIKNKMRALMSAEEINEYIDASNAFTAMVKESQY